MYKHMRCLESVKIVENEFSQTHDLYHQIPWVEKPLDTEFFENRSASFRDSQFKHTIITRLNIQDYYKCIWAVLVSTKYESLQEMAKQADKIKGYNKLSSRLKILVKTTEDLKCRMNNGNRQQSRQRNNSRYKQVFDVVEGL